MAKQKKYLKIIQEMNLVTEASVFCKSLPNFYITLLLIVGTLGVLICKDPIK